MRRVTSAPEANLEQRLHLLAYGFVSEPSRWTHAAVELAEDLVASGFTGTATEEVAVLPRDILFRDAEPSIQTMLVERGVDLPARGDFEAQYRMLLKTFGYWRLPFAEFFQPFVDLLPVVDKQDRLDRTLNRLFDEWEAAESKEAQREVSERMRAAIRADLAPH